MGTAPLPPEPTRIPFRMHPRVFAALGADLVTNDVVAVIELVKNAYDAFAQNVYVRFGKSSSEGPYIEIADDGHGMTRDVIENVWCLVATPHKQRNPTVTKDEETRRVTGAKGLGRLSVARLGARLSMVTQATGEPCWNVTVDWADVSDGDDLSGSYAVCERHVLPSPFQTDSGTRLRIHGLHHKWETDQIADLEQNLARLISPFANVRDFRIFLSKSSKAPRGAVEIKAPAFLSNPKYTIHGEVDDTGNMNGVYKFRPIVEGKPRRQKVSLSWRQIRETIQDRTRYDYPEKRAECGPFSFEIRAWDIGPDDTTELAERFNLQKSDIRKAIRTHKGISVYRDNVLVLPKSDNARDWLGLDLRRVSRVGTRLSTTQIVGYVSISADLNPRIEDTSDRERLTSRVEVAQFQEILKGIVAVLENERENDRSRGQAEQHMTDLFADLTADDLVEDVTVLAEEGAPASEAAQRVREFSERLDSTRRRIERRFDYYSRLATVGTIAQMLVHEIRTRTTAFGGFIDFVKEKFESPGDLDLEEEIRLAEQATDALEGLADTFLPLASRAFRQGKRHSILEDRIRQCVGLLQREIEHKRVRCTIPTSRTAVAIDPGELDTVILNLLANALYWIVDMPGERALDFHTSLAEDGKNATVRLSDTGPGLDKADLDRVFLPGVTSKPNGIGMGLTVVQQLVRAHGGRITASSPGHRGAVFTFDLPLHTKRSRAKSADVESTVH